MKKQFLLFLICLLSLSAFAQNSNNPPTKETGNKAKLVRPNKCPRVYLTLSSGMNNNNGFLGFSFDVPVEKWLSVEGGVGSSTWGTKLHLGGKYYLDPCNRGWAFGTGVTFNTGIQGFRNSMETVTGQTENVVLNLNPQTNLYLAAYRFWNLGRRYNRVFLEMGWSVPLNKSDYFDQTYGTPISDKSKFGINMISPGGLIAGVGFSFAIY